MRRWLFFLYGAACHVMFLLLFAYMAGFVGNFAVPKTIDSGAGTSPAEAIVVAHGLVVVVGVDPHLAARFDPRHLGERAANKAALQAQFGPGDESGQAEADEVGPFHLGAGTDGLLRSQRSRMREIHDLPHSRQPT